ncbi:putative phage abortive infection protein [Peribacillus simplex]|uniref:putative phage abortive infection protein n=1 Tax=Peribacillus simplex TaxID=1478 RepID=UPI003D295BFE
MEEEKIEFKSGWSKAGKISIILAILNPFIIMLVSKTGFTVSSIGTLGTVGDFFGGTTVGLLSLASIFFIIHTITIQGEELRLTRDEFITGNTTAKVQQIDNAFFNMLSLHHQIVNNIKLTKGHETYTGREAIEQLKLIYEDMFGLKPFLTKYPGVNKEYWRTLMKDKKVEFLDPIFKNEDTINQESLDEVYKEFHDKYGNSIGHYMRFNYRIVKFIDNNVANDENEQKRIFNETGRETIIGDRRYYFGMLRAQWSNAEFELILINSLYTKNKKFKDLILKYDVLDIKESEKAEQDKHTSLERFKLKDSMDKFKPYRSLIEIEHFKEYSEPKAETPKKKWKWNSWLIQKKK